MRANISNAVEAPVEGVHTSPDGTDEGILAVKVLFSSDLNLNEGLKIAPHSAI